MQHGSYSQNAHSRQQVLSRVQGKNPTQQHAVYQLVPPHDHRHNIAEKAIQVFKAHFISILCGTDKVFPLHLWDRLLGQAEHNLNMLQTSRMMPSVSAYAYLWGEHNLMQTLLHHSDARWKHMSCQAYENLGHPTQQTVSTSEMHGSTTAVTRSTSVIPSI